MGWKVQFFLYGFVMLKEKKVKLLSMSMDCSIAGFSIRRIFQARILEWVAISFSRSSWPRDWTWVSRIVGRCFTVWATREDVERCYNVERWRFLPTCFLWPLIKIRGSQSSWLRPIDFGVLTWVRRGKWKDWFLIRDVSILDGVKIVHKL